MGMLWAVTFCGKIIEFFNIARATKTVMCRARIIKAAGERWIKKK